MRNNIDILDDQTLIDLFIQEAPNHLLSVFRSPPSNFVREIAALIAWIYLIYNNKRTCLPVFGDLNSLLIELIQIPDLCENALDFGLELSRVFYSLNVTFVSFLPNFFASEFSDKAILLCSQLPHIGIMSSTVIPAIFPILEGLSANAIASTCRIVNNILSSEQEKPQPLIDFAIMCLSNPNDNIVFEAIDIFEHNELIPYQDEIVLSVFRRLGNDPDLTVANVSTKCLKMLRNYYLRQKKNVEPVILQLLQTQFEDENDLRCMIRCYSILDYDSQTDLEMAFSNLGQFCSTPFCVDAAYSITKITKRTTSIEQFRKSGFRYIDYFPQSFSAVFMILESDSLEVRLQVYQFLTNLCIKADSQLSIESKMELSEPFLDPLLTKLITLQSYDEEFFPLLRLIASYCTIIQTFNSETFLKLMEVAYEVLTTNAALAPESIYVFASIINKSPEAFAEMFTKVAPIVFAKLKDDLNDDNLVPYSLSFFTKSIEASAKLQLLNEDFNAVIAEVCNVAIQLTDFKYFAYRTRYASWEFFLENLTFNTEFLTQFLPMIFGVLCNTDEKDLHVIGLMCRFVNIFFSNYEGNEFDECIPALIYGIVLEGVTRDEWDGDPSRQSCVFCLLKLLLRNSELTLNLQPEILDEIFNSEYGALRNIQLMEEYISDETQKQEFTENLAKIKVMFQIQDQEKTEETEQTTE